MIEYRVKFTIDDIRSLTYYQNWASENCNAMWSVLYQNKVHYFSSFVKEDAQSFRKEHGGQVRKRIFGE